MNELLAQSINLLGAMLLMLAFAMISQRRILSLINLFTLQGLALVVSTVVVGYITRQPHLYLSAALTLLLKVLLIPWLLHRVIDRLDVRWDIETLINIPTTMLVGVGLVIIAFNVALPVMVLKLTVGGAALALLETLAAKMRIFRVPEFLAGAFLLAVIGMLVHLLLAGAAAA